MNVIACNPLETYPLLLEQYVNEKVKAMLKVNHLKVL